MRALRLFAALVMGAHAVSAAPPPATSTSQPARAPAEEKAVCTLGNDVNAKLAENPTADQIKAALAALDGDKVNAVYLNRDKLHSLQVNWDAANSVSFQYMDGGDDHMYQTSRKYPSAMALKVLRAYADGTGDWLKLVNWEPMK